MKFDEDLKKLKQDMKVEEEKTEKVETQPVSVPERATSSSEGFDEATERALSNFKPQYDNSKSMKENGKEIAQIIALNEAMKDQEFMGEMKEGAKKEIRTDMDTDQKEAEFKNQNAFYKQHKPVLKFAKMDEPCSSALMKWTFWVSVIFYVPSLIIGGLFSLLGKLFESINGLFNSIVGRPEYHTDKDGNLIMDADNKPIQKNTKVNLLTKIIFWFVFVSLSTILVFSVIKGLTGFDVIQSIRNLFG